MVRGGVVEGGRGERQGKGKERCRRSYALGRCGKVGGPALRCSN